MTPSAKIVSQLLRASSEGSQTALERLMPLVYEELHRLAHRHMKRERPGHTLQTSALVNETYLRLVDQRNLHGENRAHFFSIASRLMRRILVDHARAHNQVKRGGGAFQVSLDESAIVVHEQAADLVALDEALTKLSAIDERKCRVVEMRFFAGMGVDETAAALGVSAITVKRDWTTAKAWLHRAIAEGTHNQV